MKSPFIASVVALFIFSGCVLGPAVSKASAGNLEINVAAPEGTSAQLARVFVDGVFIGNPSERMPVLYLKRGVRMIPG